MRSTYKKIIALMLIILLAVLVFSAVVGLGADEAYWRGLTVSKLTAGKITYYEINSFAQGVVATESEGIAFDAGLREGDIITGINGNIVYDLNSFRFATQQADKNGSVVVAVNRNDRQFTVNLPGSNFLASGFVNPLKNPVSPFQVTAGNSITNSPDLGNSFRYPCLPLASNTGQYQSNNQSQPQQSRVAQNQNIPSEGSWLGMEIEPVPGQGGLPIEVSRGSVAEKAGMRDGDIITAINGLVVINMADYIRATRNEKITSASIEVLRNGDRLLISVSPESATGMANYGNTSQISNSTPDNYQTPWNVDSPPSFVDRFNKLRTPPISKNSPMTHEYRGVCSKCHQVISFNSNYNYKGSFQTGITSQADTGLPSPAQQNASNKVLVEGHWLGMELIPLSPELVREYKLPEGIFGLLVDEVTLESAESGLLAGDVMQSINGYHIKNLKDFTHATRTVESFRETDIGVLRDGRPITIRLRSSWGKLGFSQNEAAQPIKPGAISPHQSRGRPCTDCHVIMNNGGQLAIDAGDILPTPPPVTSDARAPHENRGNCASCHVIINRQNHGLE